VFAGVAGVVVLLVVVPVVVPVVILVPDVVPLFVPVISAIDPDALIEVPTGTKDASLVTMNLSMARPSSRIQKSTV